MIALPTKPRVMPMRRCFFYCVTLFFLATSAAHAQSDDGFGDALKIEGEHFNIYYKSHIALEGLLKQLSVSPADEMLSKQSIDTSSLERTISSKVEVLFNRAGDILDMHVYSFQGSIKIFPSMKDMTDYYNTRFHANLPCTGYAFYSPDDKSIYVSADNFRREVLGHEIGHAIMSGYFVVQPSMKVQEVLAGYVEYQLRKSE